MVEFKSKIIEIKDYGAADHNPVRVFKVKLLVTVPPFNYVPGQFAMLGSEKVRMTANSALYKWASFSISSSPTQEGFLEFAINDGTPEGVSHCVFLSNVGEELFVKGPFGKFTLNESAFDRFLLIATGTGVAPIMSMARFLLDSKNAKPIHVFYGFRFEDLFLYKEELEGFSRAHENFSFTPIVSRPSPQWKGLKGHVQSALKETHFEAKEKTGVYICGRPPIVEEIVAALKTLGFPEQNIFFEKW
ncbi:MAG: hypothetical protein HY393_04635 [Candidatus Diapherotrites archaeon]|nr:hypothetical protein [Candidatus Diapherotrites archaeon]